MDITLDQARAFCALVEEGGYQLAAARLHKSHSAIVYAVSNLEEQLALSLLDRRGYRTRLTSEGNQVYHECLRLLEAKAHFEQVCTELKGGWESKLTLVYDGVLSPKPLLDLFDILKEKKAPTVLHIHSEFLTGVEKTFQELDADLMIGVLSPKVPSLKSIELHPTTNLLVAHRDHPLVKVKTKWSLEDLTGHLFLTVKGAHQDLNLGTQRLEESSMIRLSDFSFKKMAILQGAGYGWLPEYLIEKELRRGLIKKIHWTSSSVQMLKPQLYYRKQRPVGQATQLILEQLPELWCQK